MALKKILDQFKQGFSIEYEYPPTFEDELNRQCNRLVIPATLLATVSWIFYIPLDRNLYTEIPLILYLRMGFSLMGLVSLVLHFTPHFKDKGYLFIYLNMYYLGYATAIILGLVAADPVYMGGFCIVVLLMALVPLHRFHSLFLLFSSLAIFSITGAYKGMTFKVSLELYGLYNLIISTIVTILGIYFLDLIRKSSFEKSRLIRSTNIELEKANKIKSELLEIAAHDLKDPLQVIIGYTDLLQMKLQEDLFAIEKLSKIYKSTDQMIKLITGLLEFTSIESGKLVLNQTEVALSQCAETAVKNHEAPARKKNQELLFTPGANCTVKADKVLLQRVLENLVSNAVKFSPLGKNIWINVTVNDSSALFKVRDEGPGLTDEDKTKIFGKFQRLSAKPTGDESSTGLGLALARELVHLQGGTIRVESETGKGSEFIVALPLAAPGRE